MEAITTIQLSGASPTNVRFPSNLSTPATIQAHRKIVGYEYKAATGTERGIFVRRTGRAAQQTISTMRSFRFVSRFVKNTGQEI